MNFLFIGFMAAGKTSLAKFLSQKIHYPVYDTDLIIQEKEKQSINHIFETKGEKYFRKLEEKQLQQLLSLENIIISTGGGIVISEKNQTNIKQAKVFVIYLKTTIDNVLEYTKNDDTRPLIKNKSKQQLQELLNKREPYYEKLAHYSLDLNDFSYEQASQNILNNSSAINF